MKSSTTPDFWAAFASLPPDIKARAKVVYRLWQHNPRHPSLQFKKTGTVWSVRIGAGYRALAVLEDATLHWFWINSRRIRATAGLALIRALHVKEPRDRTKLASLRDAVQSGILGDMP